MVKSKSILDAKSLVFVMSIKCTPTVTGCFTLPLLTGLRPLHWLRGMQRVHFLWRTSIWSSRIRVARNCSLDLKLIRGTGFQLLHKLLAVTSCLKFILTTMLTIIDRGAMMGVMLHTNGKSLIEKEKYKDALDVLSMAEVSILPLSDFC